MKVTSESSPQLLKRGPIRNGAVYVPSCLLINNNSFVMSFSDNNPCSNPFYFEQPSYRPYPLAQMPFPYPLNEVQYRMYLLYEQNRILQQQLIQQKYTELLAHQESENENTKAIKLEEPARPEQHSSNGNSNPETDKCIQQTEAISKDIFKRGNKIRKAKPQKNETKNIPKNYGKAIVSFIENNKELVRRVLSKFSSMSYISFMNILRARKNKINSIADLRSFWLEAEQEDFPKIARILSNVFLRHFSLEYIFNSRISNYSGHVKYRARLIQALRNPRHFTSIKQY